MLHGREKKWKSNDQLRSEKCRIQQTLGYALSLIFSSTDAKHVLKDLSNCTGALVLIMHNNALIILCDF